MVSITFWVKKKHLKNESLKIIRLIHFLSWDDSDTFFFFFNDIAPENTILVQGSMIGHDSEPSSGYSHCIKCERDAWMSR